MKKVLGLLLASTLVLGACGNSGNDNKDSKTESVNENKNQFKNDTLVIDDAVLKIKDIFIVNDKNSDDKLLTFKYEVKNKTDKDEITASNVWIASTKVEQEDSNTVNKLDVGVTPSTGKYKEWFKHSDDTIKKGETAKGIMSYTLQNDEDVTLKLYKGAEDKELGSKKIKLDDLKTVDYDATEDITNDSADVNSDSNNETQSNDSEQKETSDEQNEDSAVANSSSNNEKQQSTNQSNESSESNDSNSNATQQSQAPKSSNNQQMSDAEIADWNKNKPTTHDESQMQGVGGHPSAFDPSISKDSQGVKKTDENGDEYYDATGQ